jgi:DNA-binding transcriptional LysR family regulator
VQIQQLRYFLAVAEVRHFTQAASALQVAQATLSKQISALEHDLGAPLFSRARGNITLTPAGEALLPLARRILADVDTARREVQDLTGLRRGRVRIGATPSLLAGLLAGALARFHEAFPTIELRVTQGGSHDLVGDLASGELDFALIVLPLQEGDPSLETVPLLSEELMVATAVERPLPLWHGEVRITDLRTWPLVMFRQGYDLREVTLAAWRKSGLEPRFAIEGGEMDAVLRFVEVGLGIAVVPSVVLAGRPGIAGYPLARPGLRRTVAVARRKDVQPTHAAREFGAMLIAHFRAEEAAGSLPSGVQSLLRLLPPHGFRHAGVHRHHLVDLGNLQHPRHVVVRAHQRQPAAVPRLRQVRADDCLECRRVYIPERGHLDDEQARLFAGRTIQDAMQRLAAREVGLAGQRHERVRLRSRVMGGNGRGKRDHA